MKILVVNCGSSSIKYKLYEMDDKSVLAAGGIEKIGLEGAFLKTKINGETKIIPFECPTHTEGIKMMFDTLLHPEYGAIKSIDGIALRVVATSPSDDASAAAVTLNSKRHTLRLTDIRVTMKGKVIGDFN